MTPNKSSFMVNQSTKNRSYVLKMKWGSVDFYSNEVKYILTRNRNCVWGDNSIVKRKCSTNQQ